MVAAVFDFKNRVMTNQNALLSYNIANPGRPTLNSFFPQIPVNIILVSRVSFPHGVADVALPLMRIPDCLSNHFQPHSLPSFNISKTTLRTTIMNTTLIPSHSHPFHYQPDLWATGQGREVKYSMKMSKKAIARHCTILILNVELWTLKSFDTNSQYHDLHSSSHTLEYDQRHYHHCHHEIRLSLSPSHESIDDAYRYDAKGGGVPWVS